MWKKRLALLLASVLFSWLLLEGVCRLFLKPCAQADQSLFGLPLPPLRVIQPALEPTMGRDNVWESPGKANPLGLTTGDLWGVQREDPFLGYTTQEDATSRHGWFRSNHLGARSNVPTTPKKAVGSRRILVYGDSFAQGSRVKQAEAWPERLQGLMQSTEVVNLGVDGYGLGQAYLRYQTLPPAYEYDDLLFQWSPECDLWRDINTIRNLGEGWASFTVMPRLVKEGDQLRVVPGPYARGTDIYRFDAPRLTPKVRQHLLAYDRFYIPPLYEENRWLGWSVTYRVVAAAVGERQRSERYRQAREAVDGEATRLSISIFLELREQARRRGARFWLVLLPDELIVGNVLADRGGPYLAVWEARVQALRLAGLEPIDLMPEFLKTNPKDLDLGYDLTHYGPKTHDRLARWLKDRLSAAGP